MEYSFKGTQSKWSQSHRKLQNGDYSTQVYCEKGKTIATIDWYPSEPQEKIINEVKVIVQGTDREANALLISKAPILLEEHFKDLEFLEKVAKQLDELGGYLEYDILERIEFKKQLIKEAT